MNPLDIAAGISSIGSIAGGLIGANSAGGLNAANRNWQTMMSNTQYQRSTEDMRKAGLNPLMMYKSGGGGPAGVPGVAPQQNPGELTGAGLANAARTMGQLPQAKADLAKTRQDTVTSAATQAATEANSRLTDQKTITEGMTQNYIDTQRNESAARTALVAGQTKNLPYQVQEILARIAQDNANAKNMGASADRTRAEITGINADNVLKDIKAKAATSGVALMKPTQNLFQDASLGVHNNLEDYYHRLKFNYQQSDYHRQNSAKSTNP